MAREVALYSSPWISGTAAEAYYGQIQQVIFVPDGDFDREAAWEDAADAMLSALQEQAAALGANAVVGVEIVADPFWYSDAQEQYGCKLQASGTAARLMALY